MALRDIFLAVVLTGLLRNPSVSSCDRNCADKPAFTPPRLVVKFGDPASARCSVCRRACLNNLYGLEKSVGVEERNGTEITWTVGAMDEWETSPMCFYNDDDDNQCCSVLPVTVYQPPNNVSISFVNHSGPMLEGRRYALQCTVRDVAPIRHLSVTFFKGDTLLGQGHSRGDGRSKPVTESYTLNITASQEDDGAQYWCEAELELGAEGPRDPPRVKSRSVTAAVHYKPRLRGPSRPEPITVTKGQPLRLNCSAEGNPAPVVTWTLPFAGHPAPGGGSLTLESATADHEGLYVCSAGNEMGSVEAEFTVHVKVDYTYIILALAIVVAVLAAALFATLYTRHYVKNKTGKYNMKDVLRLRKSHVAVPTV